MSIGLRIKEARQNARLTQQELAVKTNLSRSYIGDIEKDRYNPSVSTLQLIAQAVNISPSSLIGDVTEGENASPGYYLNPEAAAIANEMKETIHILLDADKRASPESLKEIQNFVKYQLAKEGQD